MNDEFDVFDRKRQAPKLAELLLDEPCLVALSRDAEDQCAFANYDLASFIDFRCGESVDPEDLRDPNQRKHWIKRVFDNGEILGRHFDFGRRPYWIVDHGECVGTMAFWIRDNGAWTDLDYSSVYVRPRYRRQGWASRILRLIKESAFELDIRHFFLSCDWGNQHALRFYLAQGMWVQSWKHAIRLYFMKDLPPWRMETEGSRVRFTVEDRVVGIAENRGDRLGWQLGHDVDKDLKWHLEATAPLALSLMGWPIIRSDEAWQRQIHSGFSDCGDFEGLAFRIRQCERYLRRQGWIAPPPNPSFATLPALVGIARAADFDGFWATLSDARKLRVPIETVDPMPTDDNPLVDVQVTADELTLRLRSGQEDHEDIDHILHLNQSDEHYTKTVEFYRELQQSRLDADRRAVAKSRF